MREAALAKEIHDAGIDSVDALYLGWWNTWNTLTVLIPNFLDTIDRFLCAFMLKNEIQRRLLPFIPCRSSTHSLSLISIDPLTTPIQLQEDYTWWPYKECSTLLDKFHYACFSHKEHSLTEPALAASMSSTLTPFFLG
jgi:hypothetical protein